MANLLFLLFFRLDEHPAAPKFPFVACQISLEARVRREIDRLLALWVECLAHPPYHHGADIEELKLSVECAVTSRPCREIDGNHLHLVLGQKIHAGKPPADHVTMNNGAVSAVHHDMPGSDRTSSLLRYFPTWYPDRMVKPLPVPAIDHHVVSATSSRVNTHRIHRPLGIARFPARLRRVDP